MRFAGCSCLLKSFRSILYEVDELIGLTQIFLQTDAKAPAYRFYKNMGFTELEGHVSFAKRV